MCGADYLAQTVLDITDVPVGTSLLIFIQTLGGSLFVSIGSNIFTNKLVSGLASAAPGLDPRIVLATGATNIQSLIPTQYLAGVTQAYNSALTTAYTASVAMAALSIIGAVAIEWKSMKGKKVEEVKESKEVVEPNKVEEPNKVIELSEV